MLDLARIGFFRTAPQLNDDAQQTNAERIQRPRDGGARIGKMHRETQEKSASRGRKTSFLNGNTSVRQ
jgi:hypothetical protein